MAITYRSVKGSALTIAELDGNFQYFTGSHAVTGSLISSGSFTITGSLLLTGSSTIIGDITNSGSLSVTGSLVASGSLISSGSEILLTNLPTSEPTTNGALWISGSSVANPDSKYIMIYKG